MEEVEKREIERVERISKKSINITLGVSFVVISLALILMWIMLNNTTAISEISKDLKERDKIVEQLVERVRELESRAK